MRFMIYADPHCSSYSSIVRSRGEKYSSRLENIIDSINWVERVAEEEQCSLVVCLGDFFDKAELNSEEITALQEIQWSNLNHVFLIGNHEMGRSNLQFSSSHLFNLCPHTVVIDEPFKNYHMTQEGLCEVCYLPYVLENNRETLEHYFGPKEKTRIIFSHNDIKGIQMGKFISTSGFELDDIKSNCNLFINGHLHNGTSFDNVINLGNLTGQNFSEDALLYEHKCLILDTETHAVEYLTNPFAFNFYKLDFTIINSDLFEPTLKALKDNSVVTIKVSSENVDMVRQLLVNCNNIVESRVIVDLSTQTQSVNDTNSNNDLSVDHIDTFIEYIKTNVGVSDLIVEELNNISGGVSV